MAQAVAALGGLFDCSDTVWAGVALPRYLAACRCFAGACVAAGVHGVGHATALQALLLRLLSRIESTEFADKDRALVAWVTRSVATLPPDMQRVMLAVMP